MDRKTENDNQGIAVEEQRPKISGAQMGYAHIVHWVTIISCLIALIAPVFILAFPNNNVLNPASIFNGILDGKTALTKSIDTKKVDVTGTPTSEGTWIYWDQEGKTGTPVSGTGKVHYYRFMNAKTYLLYDEATDAVADRRTIEVDKNGRPVNEGLWNDYDSETQTLINKFPGGHFYLKDFLKGDAFAQFGIAFGCSVTMFALIPLLWFSIKKRDFFFAGASLFIILLIGLSMSGILAMQA